MKEAVFLGESAGNRTIEVIAHRGANHLAPENTFASASACIELGVDYVEIDVRKSRDGIYYIIHDPFLSRTTNGFGVVGLTHSEKLDKLDAGEWFGEEFRGEKIPKLKEFLSWCKGRINVYLDVKSGDLEEIAKIVDDLEMSDQTFFWFFSGRKARKFRSLFPHLSLKVNARSPKRVAQAKRKFNADIIECQLSDLSKEFIASCRKEGLKIMVRAKEDSVEEYISILRSQADMVNLDRPGLFLEVKKDILNSAKN